MDVDVDGNDRRDELATGSSVTCGTDDRAACRGGDPDWGERGGGRCVEDVDAGGPGGGRAAARIAREGDEGADILAEEGLGPWRVVDAKSSQGYIMDGGAIDTGEGGECRIGGRLG